MQESFDLTPYSMMNMKSSHSSTGKVVSCFSTIYDRPFSEHFSSHETLGNQDSTSAILNSIDAILQDDWEDQLVLEPTPINTDPSKIRIVPRVTVVENPIWCQNDSIRGDIINVLLQQKQAKRLRPTQDDDEYRNQPVWKKLHTEPTNDIGAVSGELPLACTLQEYLTNEQEVGQQTQHRIQAFQAKQWWDRFHEMILYKQTFGHCCVSNTFPSNPSLAQWVKRQRYQYKLKQEGKHSTLTAEREFVLAEMGFIWDAHGAAWIERWNELAAFRADKGHSNVPTNNPENQQLAIWVKCQRRQYVLYLSGGQSNITPERISKLEALGFVWNPRRPKDSKFASN